MKLKSTKILEKPTVDETQVELCSFEPAHELFCTSILWGRFMESYRSWGSRRDGCWSCEQKTKRRSLGVKQSFANKLITSSFTYKRFGFRCKGCCCFHSERAHTKWHYAHAQFCKPFLYKSQWMWWIWVPLSSSQKWTCTITPPSCEIHYNASIICKYSQVFTPPSK